MSRSAESWRESAKRWGEAPRVREEALGGGEKRQCRGGSAGVEGRSARGRGKALE
ncbi:hypothetical protein C8Q70DRAFT_987853 [Cubamyces menziesii]|nr:hypothetical protein C8Q70DRAFT_987853 [Cubamyces menziesii]